MVLRAIEAKETDEAIAKELVSAGTSPSEAPSILGSIRDGFKCGVQSRVMETRVHPTGDGDPYYLAAFAQGRFAMRFTTPGWVLLRAILPYLIAAGILTIVLWEFVF